MAAIGAIPPDALNGFNVLGELGLDGSSLGFTAKAQNRFPMKAKKGDPRAMGPILHSDCLLASLGSAVAVILNSLY
jgi:hypothetical protein